MSVEETARVVIPGTTEAAQVIQPPVRVVGVTKVVGPPGPQGPQGDAGDPALVGAAITAYMETNSEAILAPHINDPTPHPAYDDIPSLSIIFKNGLV